MVVAPRLKPTSDSQPRDMPAAQASIELYWLPLGAGGWFVNTNGRIWEAIHSHDPVAARRLVDLVGSLPSPVWGRDELGTGEMWNSNSVIAWLLARSGLPTEMIRPPAGGRAPGWEAGLTVAHRQPPTRDPAPVKASSTAP